MLTDKYQPENDMVTMLQFKNAIYFVVFSYSFILFSYYHSCLKWFWWVFPFVYLNRLNMWQPIWWYFNGLFFISLRLDAILSYSVPWSPIEWFHFKENTSKKKETCLSVKKETNRSFYADEIKRLTTNR